MNTSKSVPEKLLRGSTCDKNVDFNKSYLAFSLSANELPLISLKYKFMNSSDST
ncbi:MAG: hypothetical protein ACD_79C00467G0006 [uncultured bacterium]|nr:MAG: hypothetical protein ACD_79C00467G0006 [uncultured bacterium]